MMINGQGVSPVAGSRPVSQDDSCGSRVSPSPLRSRYTGSHTGAQSSCGVAGSFVQSGADVVGVGTVVTTGGTVVEEDVDVTDVDGPGTVEVVVGVVEVVLVMGELDEVVVDGSVPETVVLVVVDGPSVVVVVAGTVVVVVVVTTQLPVPPNGPTAPFSQRADPDSAVPL